MTFSYWLEQQFIAWMAKEKQRKTISAFADHIGVSQSLMTRYLNGQMLPTGDNIHKIAARLGPEVYDLLGLIRPDPILRKIISRWDKLPLEYQQELSDQIDKYLAKNETPIQNSPKTSTS